MSTGRPLLLEISNPKAQELVLLLARSLQQVSCQGPTVSVWPTAVTFQQDPDLAAVADVTANTSLGPITSTVPLTGSLLTAVEDGVRTALTPILGLLGTRMQSLAVRVVDDGALAGGIALEHIPTDDSAWNAFHEDILAGQPADSRDWGIVVDAATMVRFLERQVAAAAAAIREGFGATIHRTHVTWGPPIVVTIAGHFDYGTPVTFPWGPLVLGIDFELTVQLDVAVDRQNRLILYRRAYHLHLDGPNGWEAGEHAGRMIRQQVDDWTQPSRYVNPVSLIFDVVPGVRLTGVAAHAAPDGLYIVGRVTINPPSPPSIDIYPASVRFIETAMSACGGGAPVFPDQQVTIRNLGGGPLYVCSIAWQGPAGVTLEGDIAGPVPGSINVQAFSRQLQTTLKYAGPRGTSFRGTLQIVSNDPDHLTKDVQVDVISGGQFSYTLEPDPLNIDVANARPGDTVTMLPDCREVVVHRDPATAEAPAGVVTIHNDGSAPVFVCAVSVGDALHFEVEPPADAVIAPGESGAIGVKFFPSDVGKMYTTQVIVTTPVALKAVAVNAQVDPAAQHQRLDLSATGQAVATGIDLAGDALCMPSQGSACRARPYFEPVPPGAMAIAVLEVGPTPPGAEVRVTDPRGELVVSDVSNAANRSITAAWYDPGDGSFAGNPCIADYKGFDASALAAVRLRVSGRLLQPAGSLLVGQGSTSLVAANGLVYLAAPDGIRVVDGRHSSGPVALPTLALPGTTALARGADGRLLATTADMLVALDLTTPEHPAMVMRTTLSTATWGLYVGDDRVYVVGKEELFVFDHALHLVHRLALPETPTRVVPLAHALAVADTSGLTVIRPNGADPPMLQRERYAAPVTEVSSFGALVVLTGASGSDLLAPGPSGLRRVAHYVRPHWSVGFVPDAVRFGRLCHYSPAGDLRLWDVTIHHLDRAPFTSAFELRYGSPHEVKPE
jgi:hypothetical protein